MEATVKLYGLRKHAAMDKKVFPGYLAWQFRCAVHLALYKSPFSKFCCVASFCFLGLGFYLPLSLVPLPVEEYTGLKLYADLSCVKILIQWLIYCLLDSDIASLWVILQIPLLTLAWKLNAHLSNSFEQTEINRINFVIAFIFVVLSLIFSKVAYLNGRIKKTIPINQGLNYFVDLFLVPFYYSAQIIFVFTQPKQKRGINAIASELYSQAR